MPKITMSAYYPDNPSEKLICSFDEVRECPICHHAIKPQTLSAYSLKDDSFLTVVRHCPACDSIFLTTYSFSKNIGVGCRLFEFDELIEEAPRKPIAEPFPPEISAISPSFCEIYRQAAAAEAADLDQVCGSGYRKALEFLVKDYLCGKYPEKEEDIKNAHLGNAISKIENPRIQALAQRCSWLGNDETHYIRKHEDRDVSDMKRFIHAILTFIVAEQAAEDALSIPSK